MKIFSTQTFNFDVKIQAKSMRQPAFFATKPMGVDFCTFTGRSSNLKNISKLPCACCGTTMITNDEFVEFQNDALFLPSEKLMRAIPKDYTGPLILDDNMYSTLKKLAQKYPKLSFQKILAEKDIGELVPRSSMESLKEQIELTQEFGPSAKKVLLKMEKHSNFFHPVEKEVFLNLRKLSHKNPQLTLKGLLNLPEVYDKHLRQLEAKQLEILNQVDAYSWSLSDKSRELITTQVIKAKEIMFIEDSSHPGKRGRAIRLFYDLEKQIPQKADFKTIMQIISTLPTSSTNADAFFIKYAQRSSSEIANRLIRMNTATIEHIKPRNRPNDRGDNDESNYIVMCSKCNSERRQTPYPQWLNTHPEMIENVQKQLDKIIHLMNIEAVKIALTYPKEVKESLYKESSGLIDVDISNWIERTKEDKRLELIAKYNRKL